MKRLYDDIVYQHFKTDEEMLFLSGPRQVGKTTVSKQLATQAPYFYLNWDDETHREILLQGPAHIINAAQINQVSTQTPIIAFDEIHKRPDWKNFLKGFYDSYKDRVHIIVTGSARLDIYKKGGDSLMGRYFQYRMHPMSVAETFRTRVTSTEISEPFNMANEDFHTLLNFGGYPKPYLKRNNAFSLRWQRLRKQQLVQEDIRDINIINDLHRLELLMEILQRRAACALTYSSLSKQLKVSVSTIARWIEILESFYYCFLIRPWSHNITRSLTKEPKIYLWDWSTINDPGAKTENFIASHLLKATHYWTDMGFGHYDLYYLRDLEKREVDFLVTKNDKPWFLVEAKTGTNAALNPNLAYFQQATGAEHAFQIALHADFIAKNCFEYTWPIIVPGKTFLSQLM